MTLKRPVGILRFNAEVMRDNGAPKEVIEKYLTDNGSSFTQIAAVPTPNENELQRMLASEKDGSFATIVKEAQVASERAKSASAKLEKLKNIQGAARSFAGGLFLNTADEIESALTGQPVEQIRAEQKQFASFVSQVDKSKVVELSFFTKRAKSYII